MRMIPALLAAFAAFLVQPAMAADPAHSSTVTVEEWVVVESGGSERFVGTSPRADQPALASYGPFRVVDASHAQMVGPSDEASPTQFAAMMQAFPDIAALELVEVPGTYDDRSNLRLGRMIRAAGLATHVPTGGSVRSGGVELFLAGASWRIDDGAQFAVHAWLDEDGMQATDYAAGNPENRKYLAYYEEMGMSAEQARSFYAMTNSAPHEQAMWLDAAEMRYWVGLTSNEPRLAYLDLGLGLN
jgi:hypothetical protein